MTPVSSDDWLQVWQKRMCCFSFTACDVLHWMRQNGGAQGLSIISFQLEVPLLWVFLLERLQFSVPALVQRGESQLPTLRCSLEMCK